MVSEVVVGELAQLAVAAIQAYRVVGNEAAIGASVEKMDKAGASMKEVTEFLRSNTIKEEVDAQAKIDAAKAAGT